MSANHAGHRERPGRRVVVFGGGGFFGAAIVARLLADGVAPVAIVARHPVPAPAGVAVLRGDAEDGSDVRRILRRGDIVVDAVGPYHARTAALLEAAVAAGADYLDLNDSPAFAARVLAVHARAAAAGVRIFSSCCSISTLPATMVRHFGIDEPRRITMYLAPETHVVVRPGTAATLIAVLHRQVRLPHNGQIAAVPGWGVWRRGSLPASRGTGRYYLFDSADVVHLPRAFPSLRTLGFYVNSGVPLLDRALLNLRRLDERGLPFRLLTHRRLQRAVLPLIRQIGRRGGAIGGEIVAEDGRVARFAVSAEERGYLVPVAPPVLVVERLIAGEAYAAGVVPHDRHLPPNVLLDYFARLGLNVTCAVDAAPPQRRTPKMNESAASTTMKPT